MPRLEDSRDLLGAIKQPGAQAGSNQSAPVEGNVRSSRGAPLRTGVGPHEQDARTRRRWEQMEEGGR